MDPESLDGLCDRAEAHIANENYDEGGYCQTEYLSDHT